MKLTHPKAGIGGRQEPRPCGSTIRSIADLQFSCFEQWISIKKVELSWLGGVVPEHRVGVPCCQRRHVNVRRFIAELKRPEHVHVLPRHRRHPLYECDGIQIPGRHLLFVHFGQQCCVVVNDCIRNQPRAIIPDLLLSFRLNLKLPAIDE